VHGIRLTKGEGTIWGEEETTTLNISKVPTLGKGESNKSKWSLEDNVPEKFEG
jgi:hypothetical protein